MTDWTTAYVEETVVPVEPPRAARRPWLRWVLFVGGLLAIGVLAVVVISALTPRSADKPANVWVQPMLGGLNVVVVELPKPLSVTNSQLLLVGGERVNTQVAPGITQVLVYFAPPEAVPEKIEIETADGSLVIVVGP